MCNTSTISRDYLQIEVGLAVRISVRGREEFFLPGASNTCVEILIAVPYTRYILHLVTFHFTPPAPIKFVICLVLGQGLGLG